MDPRAARTRASLQRAILDLAAERPIGEIPATEIVARAGVNRSSLYQHFEDREELLASALESIEVAHTRIDHPVTLSGGAEPPPELQRFVAHFAEYAAVYRTALGPHGSARVATRVRARITAVVHEGIMLSAPGSGGALPIEVEAAGTAGALLGIIEEWIRRDPMPSTDTATAWLWGYLRAARSPSH
ncbi:TetR/AcrR family transcriptional regulator [Leucobacter rhizosphaerae]|uniref:TetR/AcrR family transcriptional regulator n=1 Tax=Leucobacter rhizosphaerae TaxID=2932245 RepID=A0ABY4FZT1_9MICO|nr:TetR/AcrR family transcriptional regulator [Leucobacter rhizosphaerae]UOQ61776.1 TetR/AcrR family transcriptional regulator [Leucobacter rhizosphaerae]